MGWAQLGKQCAGCVSSTQPKQTGPLHTPACGTVGKIGWLMLAGLTAGPQKGCVSSLGPSYPWLRGSAAASSGSLGRRRAGECKNPRNTAQPQRSMSPGPPPALRCGPWRAVVQHLLHRWWMDAGRSTFASARKGDRVCQHLDQPTASTGSVNSCS